MPAKTSEVTLVYLGHTLPRYVTPSLHLMAKCNKMDIRLITNVRQFRGDLDSVITTDLTEFYNPAPFSQAKKRIYSSHGFRDGLWIKSFERLYVLSQYAKHVGVTSLFHAELDQLLFGVEDLVARLDSIQDRGIFVPFHNPNNAILSVMYCNEISILDRLTHDLGKAQPAANEMAFVAEWSRSNQDCSFALPTIATELLINASIPPKGVEIVDTKTLGGLVDAAQLGQWVGGIDPRNCPPRTRPMTKFVDAPAKHLLDGNQLNRLRFSISQDQALLSLNSEGHAYRVYNLHIHSKIHWTLAHREGLSKLIRRANQDRPYMYRSARWNQVTFILGRILRAFVDHDSFMSVLQKRFYQFFGLRPTSRPFISGDTFRKVATHLWEDNHKRILSQHLSPGDTIFCQSELLPELHDSVLAHTTSPVVIILGNSDRNHQCVSELDTVTRGGNVLFAQNLDYKWHNHFVLPIGLENAWRSRNGNLSRRLLKKAERCEKTPLVMWGFEVTTNSAVRLPAFADLQMSSVAFQIPRVGPRKHQALLAKFAFVAAPPGNGLDTHRMWEAMYFRCIPIVLRSQLTSFYSEIGLPVWLVDSYSELMQESTKTLMKRYEELAPRFQCHALWVDHWYKQIEEQSQLLQLSDQ